MINRKYLTQKRRAKKVAVYVIRAKDIPSTNAANNNNAIVKVSDTTYLGVTTGFSSGAAYWSELITGTSFLIWRIKLSGCLRDATTTTLTDPCGLDNSCISLLSYGKCQGGRSSMQKKCNGIGYNNRGQFV